MASAPRLNPISVDEYLAGEEQSRTKHEYVAGRVYAMVGGTYRHNLIASNVLGELFGQLKGKPSRALNSDSRVRIDVSSRTRFYYPDVSVVCDPNQREGSFQDNPTLIVEVLSASTRRTDEGEKMEAYTTLPALNVYLILEQDEPAAVLYRRFGSQFLRETYSGTDQVVPLPGIGAELRMDSIYEAVDFVSEPDVPDAN